MKFIFGLLGALTAIASLDAISQESFKCKVNGATVYQDKPCPGMRASQTPAVVVANDSTAVKGVQKVEVAPAQSVLPSSTSPVSDIDRQKAYLAERDRDRKREKIKELEREIVDTQKRMDFEMEALRAKKGYARNNLAGATWEQSISTEMQAVASKYNADINNKREQIRMLQAEIDRK